MAYNLNQSVDILDITADKAEDAVAESGAATTDALPPLFKFTVDPVTYVAPEDIRFKPAAPKDIALEDELFQAAPDFKFISVVDSIFIKAPDFIFASSVDSK